jgi:preprotein translocase subunit YajC
MHGRISDFSEKLNAIILETGAGKVTIDQAHISMELSDKLNKPEEEKKIGKADKKPAKSNK